MPVQDLGQFFRRPQRTLTGAVRFLHAGADHMMYNLFMAGFVGPLPPDSFDNFGELLRERAELSQRELALQVGYHHCHMSRIEKNEELPDSAILIGRFVPALGLEDEPRWTGRLLRLAARAEKNWANLPTQLPVQRVRLLLWMGRS